MFLFAKVLQAVGIADVGYALLVGIPTGDLWKELKMSAVGIVIFYLGRWIEPKA